MRCPSWCASDHKARDPHRSRVIVIPPCSLSLFSEPATPSLVLVEIYCDTTLLQPSVAYVGARSMAQLASLATDHRRT